jgi:hypothetical protein
VLELDAPAAYELLPQPGGQAATLQLALAAESVPRRLSSSAPLVRAVRIDPSGGRSLVTIDLARPGVAVKEMVLSDPTRIVLDLSRDDARVASTAGAPTATAPTASAPIPTLAEAGAPVASLTAASAPPAGPAEPVTGEADVAPAGGAGLPVPAAPTAPASRLADVRVGTHHGFTRVVLELDEPSEYQVLRRPGGEPSPLQLLLAAQGVPRELSSNSPLVRAVRVEPNGDRSLVSIDLTWSDVALSDMMLLDPPRIVLDLSGAGTVTAAAWSTPVGSVLAANDASPVSAAPLSAADLDQSGRGPASEEVGEERAEEGKYKAERSLLERRGGVLVPAGQLVIEPSFHYTNNTRNRLNVSGVTFLESLLIGRVDVSEIDRTVYTSQLGFLYGLHDRLELEVNVPYVARSDRFFSETGTEDDGENDPEDRLSNSGLGDVQVGLLGQLFYQDGWWPDTVVNLQVKAPTGEDPFEVDDDEVPLGLGTWGLSGGVTMVRTIDPAVLYGSFRYLWDLEEDFGGPIGEIDFGDTWEYSGGLAFSLNERLALSLGLEQSITSETKQDGSEIRGTDLNAARFFLGGSYRASRLTTLNLSLGVGITDDAPDFSLELSTPLRLPYTFWHF